MFIICIDVYHRQFRTLNIITLDSFRFLSIDRKLRIITTCKPISLHQQWTSGYCFPSLKSRSHLQTDTFSTPIVCRDTTQQDTIVARSLLCFYNGLNKDPDCRKQIVPALVQSVLVLAIAKQSH